MFYELTHSADLRDGRTSGVSHYFFTSMLKSDNLLISCQRCCYSSKVMLLCFLDTTERSVCISWTLMLHSVWKKSRVKTSASFRMRFHYSNNRHSTTSSLKHLLSGVGQYYCGTRVLTEYDSLRCLRLLKIKPISRTQIWTAAHDETSVRQQRAWNHLKRCVAFLFDMIVSQ